MTITAYRVLDLGSDTLLIESSSGSVVSSALPELLEFLRYSSKDTKRAFFDLDESVAPILRKFPQVNLLELATDHKTIIGNTEIVYYPSCLFQVGYSRYYSLKQFYNIIDHAPDYPLEEVQSMAEEVLHTLGRMGYGDFTSMLSVMSCFKTSTKGKAVLESLPKGWDIPPAVLEVLDYADAADHRDWVTACQLGHWPSGLYDWDKTSCYMSIASQLYDLRDLEFWKSESFGPREYGALFGFVKGVFNLDPAGDYAHCSPIVINGLNDLPGNPLGRLPEDIYSLDEVRTVRQYGIGEFAFTDGWFARPLGGVRPRLPFKALMQELYDCRAMSPLASTIAKGMGNHLIGLMAQQRETPDSIRNEIYHALITSQARCEITKFLIENEVGKDELVSVQTDGARILKNLPSTPGNGMGSWHCNGDPPTIVLSPRKVYTQDKKPYRVTYDDILEMVGKEPGAERYVKQSERHVTLTQAMEMDDVFRVGEYAVAPAGFDILGIKREQNRVYKKLPRTGQELLDNKYQSEAVVMK